MNTAPDATDVSRMLAQADRHFSQKERSEAFKILHELRESCRHSEADQLKIAKAFGKIGEWTVALEIREPIAARHPESLLLQLDVFEAHRMSTRNREGEAAVLAALLKSPQADAASWNRGAQLYNAMGLNDKALGAMRKCVSLSNRDAKYMEYYISLMTTLGKHRAAKAELRDLLKRSDLSAERLRDFAELGLRLRDEGLAVAFAEAQRVANPNDPYSAIFLARYYHLAKDDDRARPILTELWKAQMARRTIPDWQWLQMARELYEVGCIKMAKEACQNLLARSPEERGAQKLAASIKYLEERGAGETLDLPSAERKTRGWRSWFGLSGAG